MPAWRALKALPWGRAYVAGRFLYERSRRFRGNLTDAEWNELGTLLRKSKGRRSNLSDTEFRHFRTLVARGFTGRR